MHGPRTALIWRAVFALLGWAILILQYALMLATPGQGVFALTLNFFSYFTILTNVLVALAMTLPVVAGGHPLGRWTASEGVRASVTMYAVVVGLVYHVLLHATWNPQGWLFVTNVGLHYLMPTAMLLDWLMFTPKGRLRWTDPAKWLAFPLNLRRLDRDPRPRRRLVALLVCRRVRAGLDQGRRRLRGPAGLLPDHRPRRRGDRPHAGTA